MKIKSIYPKGLASVWRKATKTNNSIKAPGQLLARGNIREILVSSIKKQRDPPIWLNGITIGSEQPVRGSGGVKNRRVGKIVAVETGLLADAIVVVVVVERGLLDKYFHRLS